MSVTAYASAEAGGRVITVSGCLDESEAEEVHRLVERALMKAAWQVSVDLASVAAFTPEGIAELADAVTIGCRLRGGMRVLLGSLQSRAAVVALCRWEANRLTWEGPLGGSSVNMRAADSSPLKG